MRPSSERNVARRTMVVRSGGPSMPDETRRTWSTPIESERRRRGARHNRPRRAEVSARTSCARAWRTPRCASEAAMCPSARSTRERSPGGETRLKRTRSCSGVGATNHSSRSGVGLPRDTVRPSSLDLGSDRERSARTERAPDSSATRVRRLACVSVRRGRRLVSDGSTGQPRSSTDPSKRVAAGLVVPVQTYRTVATRDHRGASRRPENGATEAAGRCPRRPLGATLSSQDLRRAGALPRRAPRPQRRARVRSSIDRRRRDP
jgi:hypothetical protein